MIIISDPLLMNDYNLLSAYPHLLSNGQYRKNYVNYSKLELKLEIYNLRIYYNQI